MAFEQQEFWTFVEDTLPEIHSFLEEAGEGLSLSGPEDQGIFHFFRALRGKDTPADPGDAVSSFLTGAVGRIREEWERICREDASLCAEAEKLLQGAPDRTPEENRQALLEFFFPEEGFAGGDPAAMEEEVRRRRTVSLRELNPAPIGEPAKEILFSSNVLLTVPPENYYDRLEPSLRERTREVSRENQEYWFDHPILMGVDTDANEMIYGLRGLAETLRYEKEQGHAPAEAEMTVILSLSVTHNGLKGLAHEYLAAELKKAGSLEGLKVYLFTEEDTRFLASRLGNLSDLPGAREAIARVFGVDGRYGRHYSFLKALAPLWTLTMDSGVKGTFKIDLDQIFPQKELRDQTGKTAFQHFQTPLWGARGVDSRGREISLGMIAGALVNEKDIHKGIYTPDVPLPDPEQQVKGETRIFNKVRAMAVSTRGEMMTRYNSEQFPGHPDGRTSCISRVHVTGGTNGILCDTLREYRPFTPAFIGRAEDQAYLLSVLLGSPAGDQGGPLLRYVHESGLIMRHDKEAFAGDAIAAAKLGTWIGDLLRQLYFSFYARFLPGGIPAVKEETDPFTGCFISPFPYTMIFLRLMLKVLEEPQHKEVLLDLASRRLGDFVSGKETGETVRDAWMAEREGWDLYYDCLDLLESGLAASSERASDLCGEVRERMDRCRIN